VVLSIVRYIDFKILRFRDFFLVSPKEKLEKFNLREQVINKLSKDVDLFCFSARHKKRSYALA
jgi:hypothetical protein